MRPFNFVMRYNLRSFTDTNSVICKIYDVGASIARPLVRCRTAARTANGRPYKVFVKEKDI